MTDQVENNQKPTPAYIKILDACDRYRISRNTFERLFHKKKLTKHKAGGLTWVDMDEVDDLLIRSATDILERVNKVPSDTMTTIKRDLRKRDRAAYYREYYKKNIEKKRAYYLANGRRNKERHKERRSSRRGKIESGPIWEYIARLNKPSQKERERYWHQETYFRRVYGEWASAALMLKKATGHLNKRG